MMRRHAAAILVSFSALVCISGARPGAASQERGSIVDRSRDWALKEISEVPEAITALLAVPAHIKDSGGEVIAGTSPRGGVYKINPLSPPGTFAGVAEGMGDLIEHGTCHVARLDVRDLDHDGAYELLATTSQVFPKGRPRFYAWSLQGAAAVLQGMARPQIRSQWSHGLAFAEGPSGAERAFVTYCGNGEIVEFQAARATSEAGFASQTLAWKQVGQLPASGEWSQSADVDNDGASELCFATGYAPHAAAIRIYHPGAVGEDLVFEQEIAEGKRFANVKFLVGKLGRGDDRELIAWWSTDHLYGGDCEVVRYRVGPEGVRSRQVVARGPAAMYWPEDGQFAVADLDSDGRPEVWFATPGGDLWCDGGPARGLRHILHLDAGLGPIAAGRVVNGSHETLYLSSGRKLLRLDARGLDDPTGVVWDE